MNHLKQAWRQLILRPGFSATVIVMLALGLGVTTAISSLFYQVLVQPLPVPEPHRLVNLGNTQEGPASIQTSFSYPMFRDLESQQTMFTGVAAYNNLDASLSYEGGAFNASAVVVSGSYFQVLSLQATVGRLIGPQDESRIDESPVVVLSHALWQSRFGGDPNVVGRTITVNAESLTVIGVAPEAFAGTELGVRAQIFAPLTMYWRLQPNFPREAVGNRGFGWVRLFARLRPGVSVEQASAGINTLYSVILRDIEAPLRTMPADDLPRFLQGQMTLLPGARGQGSIEGAAQSLALLLGVTLLVLLIVCVNVANLLLVRGASRIGEMAVREAMGASRGRLIAQLLIETAAPVAAGGVLSVVIAALALRAVAQLLPARLADALTAEIGPLAASFAAFATVAALLLCGLFPALRTARTNLSLAMKGYASQALGGHGAGRTRGALVTAQIAFAMVLLVLSALFARSLQNVARIELGIDIDSLVSFSVAPRQNGYSPERTAAIYDRIEQELAAQPGVTSAASGAVPLIGGSDFVWTVGVEGLEDRGQVESRFNVVGPSFFSTLSIPVLAGREFTLADTTGAQLVAIVNERFTRDYGLGRDALGKHIQFGGPQALEIVGVVADAAYASVKAEVPAQLFVPRSASGGSGIFSMFGGSAYFYVRAGVDPDALLRMIPRVVGSIDATLPVGNVITMRRQAQDNIFLDRLVTILSTSFAGLAALLAASGLYGVLAYGVTQRTRELGLRLALGAEPANLRALVLRQVALWAVMGIAVGGCAALGLGRLAESLLYGLTAFDVRAVAAAAVTLSLVMLAAAYFPARRASRIAPMDALRNE
ncbi:MAG TPA: ABC transporter permease [Gammaproteobacteria bacterium]|nr:ABC transporter permease [Gammaproteobacteria bacterium]